MTEKPTTAMMIIGTIVFVATLGAWLFAEFNHIGTVALLAFAAPVVVALFVGQQLGATRDAAQQAAAQTNGALDSRIKAGVAAALADRDAARTRQANGDISGQPAVSVLTATLADEG